MLGQQQVRRPVGDNDEESHRAELGAQVAEEIDRRDVGPVQVVEEHDERLAPATGPRGTLAARASSAPATRSSARAARQRRCSPRAGRRDLRVPGRRQPRHHLLARPSAVSSPASKLSSISRTGRYASLPTRRSEQRPRAIVGTSVGMQAAEKLLDERRLPNAWFARTLRSRGRPAAASSYAWSSSRARAVARPCVGAAVACACAGRRWWRSIAGSQHRLPRPSPPGRRSGSLSSIRRITRRVPAGRRFDPVRRLRCLRRARTPRSRICAPASARPEWMPPGRNSIETTPSEKISDARRSARRQIVSGDMYGSVPMMDAVPVCICAAALRSPARLNFAIAEVEHLYLPSGRKHDVERLQVAMDDASRARHRARRRPVRRCGPAPGSTRQLAVAVERRALDVLHDEKTNRLGRAASPMSWSVQMFGWFSAAMARASRSKRSRAARLGTRWRQHLDCHCAVQARVAGSIDFPHATGAGSLR